MEAVHTEEDRAWEGFVSATLPSTIWVPIELRSVNTQSPAVYTTCTRGQALRT